MRSSRTTLSLLLFLLLAAPGFGETVDVLYVGPTGSAEWRGVRLGVDEANVQGQFTGRSYVLHHAAAGGPLPEVAPAAVLAAGDRALLERLVASYAAPATAVLNLTLADDDLRRVCRPNLLHVVPSARMRRGAVAQWHENHNNAPVEARAWHGDFLKFAARDLNNRYRKAHGEAMRDGSWVGWMAVKTIADAVARLGPLQEGASRPEQILAYLREEMEIDGQKGVPMSFHESGQLLQPLLLVEDERIVGEAPVRGVADVEDLASLGLEECAPVEDPS